MTEKQTQEPSSREIIGLLLQTSKPYRVPLSLALIIATLTILGGIASHLLIAQLLDMIQAGKIYESSTVWQLASLYAAVQIWSEIIGWRITIYLAWKVTTAIQRDLYQHAFTKLMHETMFFHTSKMSGSLVSQVSKLVGAAERFWDTILWSILPLAVSLIASIAILSTLLWQYALFLAVLSLIFGVAVFFGTRPMIKLNEKEAEAGNAISGQLADTISNILAVKSAGAEEVEQRTFAKHTTTWRRASLGLMGGFLRISTAYSSITTSIKVAAVFFAILAAQQNAISIATIYLIVTYTAAVARELWSMNSIMRSYNRILGDARAMVDILTTPTHLVDTSRATIAVKRGDIAINAITYTHDEGKGATLFKDFSLKIHPGEKVGLVGASGSGKTTLTKLLLRFANVDSGEITIDKQNIADVTQASLRSQIAYVPQEPILFHRSVRENIAYSKPTATDNEIRTAARKAGALDFIEELANGFDTIVGERGVKLSGGQRQRIAIARAILKDAPIFILDEATSALDSESEALIQKSLDNLMKNRTSIVIAHRLSTIAKLDRIVVMKKGRIIEDGTHDNLLAKNGTYAKLWQRQSGGFIEE